MLFVFFFISCIIKTSNEGGSNNEHRQDIRRTDS
nr:MAG TPA: hypothetical protein [Caudoviricetes sp.]